MLARKDMTYLETSSSLEVKVAPARPKILVARPKKDVNYSELRKAAMKRFAKTLARLAE